MDLKYKPRHIKALLQLSRASGLYPEVLALRGVDIEELPVDHGSYGDVYKGRWKGKLIAVKIMRIYQTSDLAKLHKVVLHYWQSMDLS